MAQYDAVNQKAHHNNKLSWRRGQIYEAVLSGLSHCIWLISVGQQQNPLQWALLSVELLTLFA